MNKRSIGTEYEEVARDYLVGEGYEIVETNFRNRRGEIDIIAKDGETLCFVEVKYRKSKSCGDPLEAVNYRQQKNICQVALFYMMKKGLNEWTPCRFDVVSVCGDEITLIKNAFEGV